MSKEITRNVVLALVGLLALSIYILACTSFSPDDTKVLYPAFDTPSGAIGMAVYDRETRGNEMLFVPLAYQSGESNLVTAPSILRAEWLANGREIVVAYSVPGKNSGDEDSLSVALIPWNTRKPTKIFQVPGVEEESRLQLGSNIDIWLTTDSTRLPQPDSLNVDQIQIVDDPNF